MGTRHRHSRTNATVALVVLALITIGCGTDHEPAATAERQRLVAERSAQVMPFDLEATTHTFRATAWGGVQTVTADEPADATNRARAREHLRAEADRFARGDFTDPAAIHGHDMPGLATIERGASKVHVAYADIPDGGRITYTTSDPALVAALHAWFDAQVDAHGAHAMHADD